MTSYSLGINGKNQAKLKEKSLGFATAKILSAAMKTFITAKGIASRSEDEVD